MAFPFAVVIPIRNASATIAATLRSIIETSPAADEIICVDDASSDSSMEVVRRVALSSDVTVRIVALGSRRGPACARNRGAEAAHTPLVAFVDSDVILQPDTLALLLQQYEAQGRGAVVSVYCERNAAGGILSDFTTFYSAFTYRSGRVTRPSHFSSQCVIVERDEFARAGGFDERFRLPTVEDIQFGFRLRDAGVPVTIVSTARVIHDSRYTVARFIRNYVRKGFDFGWVLRQRRGAGLGGSGYGSLGDIASLGLLAVLGVTLILSRRLPSGTWVVALAVLVALWRDFIRATFPLGLWRGILFVILRAAVLLLSAGAACAGFIRGSDHPGPWHARQTSIGGDSGIGSTPC